MFRRRFDSETLELQINTLVRAAHTITNLGLTLDGKLVAFAIISSLPPPPSRRKTRNFRRNTWSRSSSLTSTAACAGASALCDLCEVGTCDHPGKTSGVTLLWPSPMLLPPRRVITTPHTPQAAVPLASPAHDAGSSLLLKGRCSRGWGSSQSRLFKLHTHEAPTSGALSAPLSFLVSPGSHPRQEPSETRPRSLPSPRYTSWWKDLIVMIRKDTDTASPSVSPHPVASMESAPRPLDQKASGL